LFYVLHSVYKIIAFPISISARKFRTIMLSAYVGISSCLRGFAKLGTADCTKLESRVTSMTVKTDRLVRKIEMAGHSDRLIQTGGQHDHLINLLSFLQKRK